jgi:hypothetical protein
MWARGRMVAFILQHEALQSRCWINWLSGSPARGHAGFQSWAEMGLAASTAPALPTSARNTPHQCQFRVRVAMSEQSSARLPGGQRFPSQPHSQASAAKSSLLTSAYSYLLHNKYSTCIVCWFFFLFYLCLQLLSAPAATLRHPVAVSHQNAQPRAQARRILDVLGKLGGCSTTHCTQPSQDGDAGFPCATTVYDVRQISVEQRNTHS